MKLRQGYINDRKKAEKKGRETRDETRATERKRKIVNLAYLAEHLISISLLAHLILIVSM